MENTPNKDAVNICEPVGIAQSGRQSSKDILTHRMRHSVASLQRMEIIQKMLPTELTPEQDDALWWLFANVNLN